MNRAERRRQKKLAQKSSGKQDLGIPQAIDLAFQHHSTGDLIKAEELYRQILDTDPNQHIALQMLGVLLHQKGDNETGAVLLQKSISINPAIPDAHFNLGIMLNKLNRLEEAIASYQQAITLKPEYAEAHNNLGTIFQGLFRLDESKKHFQQALIYKPDYLEAHNNLGITLKEQGNLDEATTSFRNALSLNPNYAAAHNNLGNVFRQQDRLDEALACFQKALEIKPDYADAHNNLGNTYKDLTLVEEAIASFRQAITCNPDFVEAHDNLLQTEHYRPGNTSDSLFHLHKEWQEHHASRFRNTWPQHQNVADENRKFRAGFVSPDLGRHPVGYFMVRLLENMPGEKIETIAYSDSAEDDLTLKIKAATDIWRFVRGWPDQKLAEAIIDDKVDILIDLAGHSANNRLLVFARKPAPIQVSWAGYVSTTGLAAMDYFGPILHEARRRNFLHGKGSAPA